MYFNAKEFEKCLLVVGAIIAVLGWGLVEVLIWAFSHITISFG